MILQRTKKAIEEIGQQKRLQTFNIEADTKDNHKILKIMSKYNFNYPRLINIRTNRLYWHSGAGVDKENIFDRLKSEEKILGRNAELYYKNINKTISKSWKSILEKL